MATRLASWLFADLMDYVVMGPGRAPDERIGGENPHGAYMNRWWLCPWRHWFKGIAPADRSAWQRAVVGFCRWFLPNLYLHEFLRDDDDRALHDHPSWSISFMLDGAYIEHTIAAGGIHGRELIEAGSLRFRRAKHAHRIELLPISLHEVARASSEARRPRRRRCWTLFLIGPKLFGHHWGFHCPERGFVPWEQFTVPGNPADVGAGCDV